MLAGHANSNTTEVLDPTTTTNNNNNNNNNANNHLIGDSSTSTSTTIPSSSSAITTIATTATTTPSSTTTTTTTNTDNESAEDALNKHQKKLALRSEAFNKARAQHMKEFQAKYTKLVRECDDTSDDVVVDDNTVC